MINNGSFKTIVHSNFSHTVFLTHSLKFFQSFGLQILFNCLIGFRQFKWCIAMRIKGTYLFCFLWFFYLCFIYFNFQFFNIRCFTFGFFLLFTVFFFIIFKTYSLHLTSFFVHFIETNIMILFILIIIIIINNKNRCLGSVWT